MLISADAFRRANRMKRTRADVGVLKEMTLPVQQVGERTLRWTISTEAVDRERDVISLKGWDLKNFRRNPVVLWGHDASLLPIGRALDVGVEDNALKASVQFVPAGMPEIGQFAEAVYRLACDGFLKATSVGFRPLKWAYTEDKSRGADDWFPGIDFLEQELVELSVVTVPANADALLDPPAPAIAQPNLESGEELTALNEEAITQRARRIRRLHLTLATLDVQQHAAFVPYP